MAKKKSARWALAMLLGAACLLSGCKGQTEVPTEQTIPTEQTAPAAVSAEVYGQVLEEYRQMVQQNFYRDLRDTDAYESSFGPHIGVEIRTHAQDVYYALADLDGNGVEELVIGGGENASANADGSPWVYDLYSYDGQQVVSVFPELEFGYRTNLTLHKGGILQVSYSSSAAESGVDVYRLDGATAELVDAFAVSGRLEGETPVFTYTQNGQQIEQAAYEQALAGYPERLGADLPWIRVE